MDLEQKSIERIRVASKMSLHYYGQPLVCTYSGGKDSDVMLELFKRSKVPFEVYNSHTTADAPHTVYHIRKVFRNLELSGIKCTIDYHVQPDGSRITMWNLIPEKLMPPTRRVRYCCQVLKEGGTRNRYVSTGVRWDESKARSGRAEFEKIGKTKADGEKFRDEKVFMDDNSTVRRMTELCIQKANMTVNPIIDWVHHDIWDYINTEHIEVNPLYRQFGYERVGCIGCPLAGKKRYKEFADFPKYKQAYIHAFEKMLQVRQEKGLKSNWKTGEEVYLWWMQDDNIPSQMSIEEFVD